MYGVCDVCDVCAIASVRCSREEKYVVKKVAQPTFSPSSEEASAEAAETCGGVARMWRSGDDLRWLQCTAIQAAQIRLIRLASNEMRSLACKEERLARRTKFTTVDEQCRAHSSHQILEILNV